MEAHKASATARNIAYMRAYHHLYNDAPKIFEDPLAQRLLTAAELETTTRRYATSLDRLYPARAQACHDEQEKARCYLHLSCAPPQALSRARYAEDKLLDAIHRGVTQYVLMGAGLDSFAWRHLDLQTTVQVFEVDHPASQAFKRQRLTDIGLPPPPHLHFVAADLEQESLAQVLRHSAYDPQIPAFFSWLGVTMYLEPAAFATTLRAIRSVAAAGSELVFDYYDLDAFDPEKVSARMRILFESVRRQGSRISWASIHRRSTPCWQAQALISASTYIRPTSRRGIWGGGLTSTLRTSMRILPGRSSNDGWQSV